MLNIISPFFGVVDDDDDEDDDGVEKNNRLLSVRACAIKGRLLLFKKW